MVRNIFALLIIVPRPLLESSLPTSTIVVVAIELYYCGTNNKGFNDSGLIVRFLRGSMDVVSEYLDTIPHPLSIKFLNPRLNS